MGVVWRVVGVDMGVVWGRGRNSMEVALGVVGVDMGGVWGRG